MTGAARKRPVHAAHSMKGICFVFTAVALLAIGYLACYYNWIPEIVGFFRNTAAEIGELFH